MFSGVVIFLEFWETGPWYSKWTNMDFQNKRKDWVRVPRLGQSPPCANSEVRPLAWLMALGPWEKKKQRINLHWSDKTNAQNGMNLKQKWLPIKYSFCAVKSALLASFLSLHLQRLFAFQWIRQATLNVYKRTFYRRHYHYFLFIYYI